MSLHRDRTHHFLAAGALSLLLAGQAHAQSHAARRAHRAAATVEVSGVVDGATIVTTARRYLGVPYRFGGTTPRAFDCSGFVRWVFAEHHITFPRTAHEQAAVGHAPPPGDLEPGDLLFFYGGQGAQHIAIYVGADTIIHASSTGHRVKLDRLPGHGLKRSWFGQRLIAVRRVLPTVGVFEIPAAVLASGDVPPGPGGSPVPPRMF